MVAYQGGDLETVGVYLRGDTQNTSIISEITYNNRMLQVHITGKGKLKEPHFPVSVISNKGICSVDGKPYRGMLYVIGDADGYLLVLNKVLMEDYLLGVVPAEIGRVGKELLEAAKKKEASLIAFSGESEP